MSSLRKQGSKGVNPNGTKSIHFAVVEDLSPWPPLLIGEGEFRRTIIVFIFYVDCAGVYPVRHCRNAGRE
jgi:hypothetical protein